MALFCAHRLLEPLAASVILEPLEAPVIEERDATWDLRSSGQPATS
jgi:hypothetical protein